MPLPFIKNFLFCMSLQTGAKVIGYYKAIVQLILQVIIFVMFMVQFDQDDEVFRQLGPLIVTICSLCLMESLFAVILLIGVHKRKPKYVKIWIIVQLGIMVQNLYTVFTIGILEILNEINVSLHPSRSRKLIIQAIVMGCDVYTTLIVYSYYRDEYYRDPRGNQRAEGKEDIMDVLTYDITW